jgi:hypothetical protein
MSLSEQQIEWLGNIFDAGTKCGIGGKLTGTSAMMAVAIGPLETVTPKQVIEAAHKIETAIRLQASMEARD